MRCVEKRIYFTEERAVNMRHRLAKIFNKDYYVYQCPNCKFFHLSTRADGVSPKHI